jgi:hypothetical protein
MDADEVRLLRPAPARRAELDYASGSTAGVLVYELPEAEVDRVLGLLIDTADEQHVSHPEGAKGAHHQDNQMPESQPNADSAADHETSSA